MPAEKPRLRDYVVGVMICFAIVVPISKFDDRSRQATPAPPPMTATDPVSAWLPPIKGQITEYGRLSMLAVQCGRLPPNIIRGLVSNSYSERVAELGSETDARYAVGALLDGAARATIAVEDNRRIACGDIDTERMLDALDKVLGLKPIWRRH